MRKDSIALTAVLAALALSLCGNVALGALVWRWRGVCRAVSSSVRRCRQSPGYDRRLNVRYLEGAHAIYEGAVRGYSCCGERSKAAMAISFLTNTYAAADSVDARERCVVLSSDEFFVSWVYAPRQRCRNFVLQYNSSPPFWDKEGDGRWRDVSRKIPFSIFQIMTFREIAPPAGCE